MTAHLSHLNALKFVDLNIRHCFHAVNDRWIIMTVRAKLDAASIVRSMVVSNVIDCVIHFSLPALTISFPLICS